MRRSRAQEINRFLTEDLLGQANPDVNDRSKKITVEELLQRAARRSKPPTVRRPAGGRSRSATGDRQDVLQVEQLRGAEKHLQEAVKLRQGALPEDHPQTLVAQEALADFLNLGQGSTPRRSRAGDVGSASERYWARHRDTLDSLDITTSLCG